ncbi:uncharacterized protein LOC130052649 [Ostrea edulis]|uniref:uncharacterized protein LOC130052649 n=1 Tax=Ostrea edulis TaxID=37623 RepID=UPI0024AEC55B|nr:uncharacterized protein LOC130052649 [Ostrea edulis]
MECIIVILLSSLLVIVNTATTQKNIGETCSQWFYWDENSHQCQSCPIGYYGPNCSLPCRYPSYGERCQKKCNCTVEYCTSDKGCIDKTNCEAGYYGEDCSLPCRYPNYGKICQSECNCTKTLCSHITGCQPSTDNVLIYTTTEKEYTDNVLIYKTTEKKTEKDGVNVNESVSHSLSDFPSSSTMPFTLVSEETGFEGNDSKLSVFSSSLTVVFWSLGLFLFVLSIWVISKVKYKCDKRKKDRVARTCSQRHSSEDRPYTSLTLRTRSNGSGYFRLWRRYIPVNRGVREPDVSGNETLRSNQTDSYVTMV